MLESVVVYFLLFVVLFSCGIVAARRGKKYGHSSGSSVIQEGVPFFTPEIIILVLSFAFIFGCRWGVGRDYYRYLYAYTEVIPERFEFLFQFFTVCLQRIRAHFSIYFGLWALMDAVLLYYAMRNYRFVFPYVAFFLIFGSYYLPMMNAVRQYLAALLFLNSIRFIEQRQFIKYGICIVLAILFHKLSIILFVIYPILRWKDDWFQRAVPQLVIFLVAVFLSLHGEIIIRWIEIPFEWITDQLGYSIYDYENLLDERYDRTRFGNNTGLGIWVKMLITIPVIIYSRDMKTYYNSSYFNMLYTLYFVGVITSLLFGQSIVLNRVALFFAIFQLIIQSLFVYYCFDKKDLTHYIIGVMIMLMQIPLFLNMVSNPNSTASYLFFWQRSLIGY